jgi:hypothetical protein
MFVRQNQQQFRTAGADVQIFYGSDASSSLRTRSWNKPTGVSHVYMMLIGGGGYGDGAGTGGGSGAVTVWYGAAQNVPDQLYIAVCDYTGQFATQISYRSGSSLINLLSANQGNVSTAGSATSAGLFASSGFYQSIAGQGGASGPQSASTTTFLSGGSSSGSSVTANYGYSVLAGQDGFFMLQPMIVGAGGTNAQNGGIGCGGGVSGKGGQGMALIASW